MRNSLLRKSSTSVTTTLEVFIASIFHVLLAVGKLLGDNSFPFLAFKMKVQIGSDYGTGNLGLAFFKRSLALSLISFLSLVSLDSLFF